MEKRITELEIKIAFQEDLIEDLNVALADQQNQILKLEKICLLLNEKIRESNNIESINQEIEVPPHY